MKGRWKDELMFRIQIRYAQDTRERDKCFSKHNDIDDHADDDANGFHFEKTRLKLSCYILPSLDRFH